MRKLLILVLNLFILSCVFDPADIVFGLKVPLFCLSWIVFLIYQRDKNRLKIPRTLGMYVFLMIFLPIVSIIYYYISNGAQPYEGFSLLKAHLLISFAVLLYLSKINIMRNLCTILTVLAVAIILIYTVVQIYPSTFIPLNIFGYDKKIFYIGERVYSADLKLWSIFFATSPMLAISIAYYVHLAIQSYQKRLYLFLALINIFAMFIAGTRNNMATALLLPVVLLVLNSRYRILTATISLFFIISFAIYYSEAILIMLDPSETSNDTKIGLLDDYAKIFSNPIDFIFGQGLGSYYYWANRGSKFDSEHTYLEIIRNFGILMGFLIILLMLYPVIYAFYLNRSYKERYIIIAYIFYLLMSITNPLFFSSLGMLFLSIILANIFIEKYKLSLD